VKKFRGTPDHLFQPAEKGLLEGYLLSWTTDLPKTPFRCARHEGQGDGKSERFEHTISANNNVALQNFAITQLNERLRKVDILNTDAESYFGV
jgi:hypothetical protein